MPHLSPFQSLPLLGNILGSELKFLLCHRIIFRQIHQFLRHQCRALYPVELSTTVYTKQAPTSSCSIVWPSGMIIWPPVNLVGLIPGYAYELAFKDVAEKASTLKSAHSERCSLKNRTRTAGGTFCQGRTKANPLNRILNFGLSFHSRWRIFQSHRWNSQSYKQL